MNNSKKSGCEGSMISLLTTFLTALFAGLKMSNAIDWSWFAVVSPLVIERALVVVLSMIVGITIVCKRDK